MLSGGRDQEGYSSKTEESLNGKLRREERSF